MAHGVCALVLADQFADDEYRDRRVVVIADGDEA